MSDNDDGDGGASEETFLVDKLKGLRAAVVDDDDHHDRAVLLCEEILRSSAISSATGDSGDDEDDSATKIRDAVYETYVNSLLRCKEFSKIVKLVEGETVPPPTRQRVEPAYLYALYGLKRYEQARDGCRREPDKHTSSAQLAMHHLLAQSNHHLSATREAWDAYRSILDSCCDDATDEQRMEAYTNITATICASAVPYVQNAGTSYDGSATLRDQIHAFVNQDRAGGDHYEGPTAGAGYPYDLAYNFATWELFARNDPDTYQLLQSALLGCKAVMEDDCCSDEETQREMAPIQANIWWGHSLWSGTVKGGAAPVPADGKDEAYGEKESVAAVRRVNEALSRPSAREGLKLLDAAVPVSVTLTSFQRKVFSYNRAVLLLRSGDVKGCQQVCQTAIGSLSAPTGSGKKKRGKQSQQQQPQPTASSDDEIIWWENRFVVLRAYCLYGLDAQEEGADLLCSAASKLNDMAVSTVRDHSLAYVLLHQAALATKYDEERTGGLGCALDTLQSLPDSVRSSPAVVASLASVHQLHRKNQEARQLLDDNQVLAEFYMSHGNYTEAMAILDSAAVADADPVASARLVRALSYVDPERAQQLWSEVCSEDVDVAEVGDADDAVATQLELREIHRSKSLKRLGTRMSEARGLEGGGISKGKKKSHVSVLRRRERHREEYIAQLEKKLGKVPAKPDPERWMPKYERSYARRRRGGNRGGGGGPHKGAQGGVSEKDSAKLDVAARQAARTAGDPDPSSGRSTAHLTVTGGGGAGRKTGRKR